MMASLLINLLRNHCWVWGWKHFEKWSTFAEVMGNWLPVRFLWNTVYTWCCPCNQRISAISTHTI